MKNVWWKEEKWQILIGVAACFALVFVWYQSTTVRSFYGDAEYGYIQPLNPSCSTIGVFVNATDWNVKEFEPIYGPRPKIRASNKTLVKIEQPWPRVFGFTVNAMTFETRKFSVLNVADGKNVRSRYPDLRNNMNTCLKDPNSYKARIDENNTLTRNTFCNMVRADIEKILRNCTQEKSGDILSRLRSLF